MSALDRIEKPGLHEQKIRARFGPGWAYDGAAPRIATPLVILAFTNRCGSNLLAEHFRSTPRFAGFHEHLNFDTVFRTCDQHGLDTFPDYLRHISAPACSAKQAFGVKASIDQLAMLKRAGTLDMFPSVHVVHMRRRDVLGQAISLLIAAHTRQWTSRQTAQTDTPPRFDDRRIRQIMSTTLEAHDAIDLFLCCHEMARSDLTYEALVADPEAELQRIAAEIGLPLDGWRPSEPPIKKQANTLNGEFRAAFLSRFHTRSAA